MFLGATPEDIQVLKRNLLELETLKLQINSRDFMEGFQEIIRFKKVKQFTVNVCDHDVNGIEFVLPFIFDELKKLEVISSSHRSRSLALCWMKFARSNDLIHLNMKDLNLSISDLMEIADQWPNLEEIVLKNNKFPTENFIEFMNKFDRLKKIVVVNMASNSFYKNDLKQKLDKKWKVKTLNFKDISIILEI